MFMNFIINECKKIFGADLDGIIVVR